MRRSFLSGRLGILAWFTTVLLLPAPAMAGGQANVEKQPEKPTPKALQPAGAGENIQTINDSYNEQRLQLDRRRLEEMSRLAARQNPTAAADTYEQLFRLAIAGNLFSDAGPIAEAVLKNGSPSPTTNALANLVKIIAESDRGAYEQSLESLRRAVAETTNAAGGKGSKEVILATEKVGICDAYYQRLVHAGQMEIARKAFQILRDQVRNPVVLEFVSNRLKRLELVGKPAPAIRGTDVDGRPFNLADARGKVVLVLFWASWCLPSAAEIEGLQEIAGSYRARGFQVVGINLDSLQEDGAKLETVMPNIRRFLLDFKVSWPTLINGSGEKNYAEAYGVSEIPANVLIGREGTVVQLDLVSKNLESVIARVTGK